MMKKSLLRFLFRLLGLAVALAVAPGLALAGIFDMPHFVSPGEFAVGIEPVLTLSEGAGLGVNLKYTQGIGELSDFTGIIGTGDGPRQFRVGGNFTFDFVPDVESQPGIGLAVQALYYRFPERGQLELTGIPYIHKAFLSNGHEFEPFIAVPLGMGFSDGNYRALSQLAFGSLFKLSEHVRTVAEFGAAINHAETYLSGGIVYYH